MAYYLQGLLITLPLRDRLVRCYTAPPMQRFVIKIMVFFLLLSSLSWAAELDESFDAFQQEHELSLHGDASDLTHAPCDECCHGCAHFFGVFSKAIIFPPILNSSYKPVTVKHRYFISQQPPTPPPTA